MNPAVLTLGQIEENSNTLRGRLDLPPFAATGTADSFFDVFFKIELPDQGLVLHNNEPARMESTITHKPPAPGDKYIKPRARIQLLDENDRPTGVFLIEAEHTPRPEDPVEEDEFPNTVGQVLVEVPGPMVTPDPQLPPLDGIYRSPRTSTPSSMGGPGDRPARHPSPAVRRPAAGASGRWPG